MVMWEFKLLDAALTPEEREGTSPETFYFDPEQDNAVQNFKTEVQDIFRKDSTTTSPLFYAYKASEDDKPVQLSPASLLHVIKTCEKDSKSLKKLGKVDIEENVVEFLVHFTVIDTSTSFRTPHKQATVPTRDAIGGSSLQSADNPPSHRQFKANSASNRAPRHTTKKDDDELYSCAYACLQMTGSAGDSNAQCEFYTRTTPNDQQGLRRKQWTQDLSLKTFQFCHPQTAAKQSQSVWSEKLRKQYRKEWHENFGDADGSSSVAPKTALRAVLVTLGRMADVERLDKMLEKDSSSGELRGNQTKSAANRLSSPRIPTESKTSKASKNTGASRGIKVPTAGKSASGAPTFKQDEKPDAPSAAIALLATRASADMQTKKQAQREKAQATKAERAVQVTGTDNANGQLQATTKRKPQPKKGPAAKKLRKEPAAIEQDSGDEQVDSDEGQDTAIPAATTEAFDSKMGIGSLKAACMQRNIPVKGRLTATKLAQLLNDYEESLA